MRRLAGSASPWMARPSMSTWPASAATSPQIIATVVVLPAPFGPSRPTISPRPTSKPAPATTARPPYDLFRPLTLNIQPLLRFLRQEDHRHRNAQRRRAGDEQQKSGVNRRRRNWKSAKENGARRKRRCTTAVLSLRPGVLEGNRKVEDRQLRLVVLAVCDEVAIAFELELVVRLRTGEQGFDLRAQDLLRVGVQQGAEVLAAGVGLRIGEEPFVEAHFCRHAVAHRQPVNRAAGLDAVRTGCAAAGFGQVLG